MAPRCMHRAALVASLIAVSMRMARSGSISNARGTRSTPLVPGMRMSHSINATLWRLSCCNASSPEAAAYTSNCCWARNFFRALRMGSSSSTTRTETGPELSTKRDSLPSLRENGARQPVWVAPARRGVRLCRGPKDEVPRRRSKARAVGSGEQFGDRLAPGGTIVNGVGVHVHAHEPVGLRRVQPAAETLRMTQGFSPMGEAVDNARLEVAGDRAQQVRAEVVAHDVAAERQGQPRLAVPPFPHVRPEMQPAGAERELALVDQQARVRATGRDGVLDLIEPHDDRPDPGLGERPGGPRRGHRRG